MLKAILFDLGNTLFDFEPINTRTVFDQAAKETYEHLRACGHTLPPYRTYARIQFAAIRWSFLWSRLRGRWRDFNCYDLLCRNCHKMGIGLDNDTMRELAWRWYSPLTSYCTVAADVVPTLSKLRDRGLRLAIVSNTFIPGFVLDRHMQLHGLLDFFPVRVYSSELGYRKPHARIFQTALDAVEASPQEAVFVGDTLGADIVGAQRMGITAILRHPTAASRTHRIADHVIRTVTDLYQILPLLGAEPEDNTQGKVA